MCRWRFLVQCINGEQCIDRHNRRQPDSPLIEYCAIAIEVNRRQCVPESMTDSHTPIPGWTACPYCRIAALSPGDINTVTLEELFSGDGTERQQSGSIARQPSVRVGETFINVSSYTSEFVPFSVLQDTGHQRTTYPLVAFAPPSFNGTGPPPTLSTTETGSADDNHIPQSPPQDDATRASHQRSSRRQAYEDEVTDSES